MSNFVQIVESIIPSAIVEKYRDLKRALRISIIHSAYHRKQRVIRLRNRPIRVVFFALTVSMWKYDSLYRAMLADESFSPLILLIPEIYYGESFMIEQLNNTYKNFQDKGYSVLSAYDSKNHAFVDLDSLNPDIIFICYPYDYMVHEDYNVKAIWKKNKYLLCFVDYGFHTIPKYYQVNSFYQSLWRYYMECSANLKDIKKYYDAANCVVTGYPTADTFASTIETGKDWKRQDNKLKRVIWAPHHSLANQTSWVHFSTFLLYSDFMLRLAIEYRDRIQFVFKPHPALKSVLYSLNDWGKERTDFYYDQWAKGENTAYVNDDYVDLFKSSDAMIHDSGSFLVEYLYVQKPVMYLWNYDRLSQSNEVGKRAYACHYVGNAEADIIKFLEDVVLANRDVLKENRESFYKDFLLPPNGMSVADNIISDIKKSIY